MSDDWPQYSEETVGAFPDEVLAECDTIAALALEGFIPKEKLPGLHHVIGTEKAGLVMEAMEGNNE